MSDQPLPPHFSPLFDCGDLVFLSGQLAFDETGQIAGDVTAQTTRCLKNIEATLAKADLAISNIVKATVWLTDKGDFVAFNRAYADYFGSHRPARSTVICELAVPGALVEIEVIARR